jgi:hypothetical protein
VSWNKVYPGRRVGSVDAAGYLKIVIDGAQRRAHRIAMKLITGKEPSAQIDHHDRNRRNNAWGNLRPATSFDQQWNKGLSRNNTSGFRGVQQQRGGRWRARIKIDGCSFGLGGFATPEEASDAYETAAREIRGKFYREL